MAGLDLSISNTNQSISYYSKSNVWVKIGLVLGLRRKKLVERVCREFSKILVGILKGSRKLVVSATW